MAEALAQSPAQQARQQARQDLIDLGEAIKTGDKTKVAAQLMKMREGLNNKDESYKNAYRMEFERNLHYLTKYGLDENLRRLLSTNFTNENALQIGEVLTAKSKKTSKIQEYMQERVPLSEEVAIEKRAEIEEKKSFGESLVGTLKKLAITTVGVAGGSVAGGLIFFGLGLLIFPPLAPLLGIFGVIAGGGIGLEIAKSFVRAFSPTVIVPPKEKRKEDEAAPLASATTAKPMDADGVMLLKPFLSSSPEADIAVISEDPLEWKYGATKRFWDASQEQVKKTNEGLLPYGLELYYETSDNTMRLRKVTPGPAPVAAEEERSQEETVAPPAITADSASAAALVVSKTDGLGLKSTYLPDIQKRLESGNNWISFPVNLRSQEEIDELNRKLNLLGYTASQDSKTRRVTIAPMEQP